MRFLGHGLAFVLTSALLGCAGQAPSGLAHCGRALVPVAGGTVTGAGATVVIQPASLAAPVDLSVCIVEVGRVPRQRSDMFEIGPALTVLRGPALVTLPVDADAPSQMIAEIRDTPSGGLTAVVQVSRRLDSPTVTFAVDRLGDIRLLEDSTIPLFDAGRGSSDANRPDAPRPIGPVAVGPDLTPADYTCLRTVPTPSVGPLAPIRVHVTDWADHQPRSGYQVRAAPIGTWTSGACTGVPDCVEGTTDASGDAMLMLHRGPVWLHVLGGTASDPAHLPAPQWVAGLAVASGATSIDVTSLSLRSQQALQAASGSGAWIALGSIRDCAGGLVQRARVRLFAADGVEVFSAPNGSPSITYGNGAGFPTGAGDRSAVDGVFLAVPPNGDRARIEAWGRFAIDAPDQLLSCVLLSFLQSGGPTMADLFPLAADPPPDCGSVP